MNFKIPTFSIIVPTYNRAKRIKLLINSLLKIKYPKENYEIIIVNDGSKDDTLEILEPFSNHLKGYTIKNSERGFARNYLISNKVKPFEHIKFCPHHPENGHVGEREKFKINCKCRKPKNEMVEEILSEFNLNEKNLDLLFIGDTIKDFELSQKYTSNFFLIKSNFSNIEEAKKLNLKIFNNLKEIQDYI